MAFELQPLPFAEDALAPHVSARTVEYHYHKHHKGYVDKLNTAIKDSPHSGIDNLEELIKTSEGKVYNNAAQVWNHDFYWQSMKAGGGGEPSQFVQDQLSNAFGSVNKFRDEFRDAAANQFGSGWAWLMRKPDGSLEVGSTSDAGNPLRAGKLPIVTLDVWEHAYYLDYQNARPDYIDAFLDHLINWEFVEENLRKDS